MRIDEARDFQISHQPQSPMDESAAATGAIDEYTALNWQQRQGREGGGLHDLAILSEE
jgi:hypothetical protein